MEQVKLFGISRQKKSKISEPGSFSRYWDFIRVNFFIMWRNLLEYKVNLFSGFFMQFFYLGTHILLLLIISDNFGFIINWTSLDFILYLLFYDLTFMIAGIFIWQTQLFGIIINGELSNFLTKPLNPFFLQHLVKLMVLVLL
ncbi:MAG: hypothetical protein JXM74_04535 [Fusobacteriaceae bacterium]|nr:hypothetical protein [Fusobacteriaceae bacterium]